VSPSDFDQLGFVLNNKYYFDTCFPMRSSISCSRWEKFSSALHWFTAINAGNENILHYLPMLHPMFVMRFIIVHVAWMSILQKALSKATTWHAKINKPISDCNWRKQIFFVCIKSAKIWFIPMSLGFLWAWDSRRYKGILYHSRKWLLLCSILYGLRMWRSNYSQTVRVDAIKVFGPG
jgi:hypothetical protein